MKERAYEEIHVYLERKISKDAKTVRTLYKTKRELTTQEIQRLCEVHGVPKEDVIPTQGEVKV
ncbi:MAG: hypothetical protein ACE5H1_01230 [Thermodesulfobacteriota bacterium]